MPHWEYKKINLNELPRKTDGIDLLNDAGNDAWELVAITANNIAYLKPPIKEPPPARPARRKAKEPDQE